MSGLTLHGPLPAPEIEPGNVVFGPAEEEGMVPMALDMPEFFQSVATFLTPDLFTQPHVQYLMTHLLNCIEDDDVIPSREVFTDVIKRDLTVDVPCFNDVIALLGRKTNHRDVPIIKKRLKDWAQQKAYGLLYNDEAIAAYYRRDFSYLEDIFARANRIAESGSRGFWFFDQLEELFDDRTVVHYSTGYPALDRIVNEGGPSPGEVVCWLAATNVGKCGSDSLCIIEERLSRIYSLEMEDGTILELRGSHEVQTARGRIKVADLTVSDELTEIPVGNDPWNLEL